MRARFTSESCAALLLRPSVSVHFEATRRRLPVSTVLFTGTPKRNAINLRSLAITRRTDDAFEQSLRRILLIVKDYRHLVQQPK